MTLVIIGRLSSTAEVGAVAHLPAADTAYTVSRGLPPLPDVFRTYCGRTVIGRTFDRETATCAFCLAMSGQHPGGHAKRYLARWHRAQQAGAVR